ncbi:hypothetical protein DEO19_20675 [Escherichia coli]|nr:hypothetical protein DEO19_20675 [Escherichia coli]
MILSGLSLWEKGSPLHKSTQQVRTQGPIRHADCRQRKLADFLCTGGIIQGLISVAHQAILRFNHFFLFIIAFRSANGLYFASPTSFCASSPAITVVPY